MSDNAQGTPPGEERDERMSDKQTEGLEICLTPDCVKVVQRQADKLDMTFSEMLEYFALIGFQVWQEYQGSPRITIIVGVPEEGEEVKDNAEGTPSE